MSKAMGSRYSVETSKESREYFEYVKDLLAKINKDAPGVKERMFTAIEGSSIKGWNNEQNELS